MGAVPTEQLQLLECQDMALVSREDLLAESIWSTQLCTSRPGLSTTKPGALAPGACLLSRGAVPRGSGAAVRSVDRVRIRCFQLWAELPAQAPGARCQSGRSVGSGAPGAVQWTATRLFRQTSDTPGTSEIRRECWSRGRIVSALLAGAQGGCLPSMEPPNPIAATMGPPAGVSNGFCPFDTALHRRQRLYVGGFMEQGQAPWVAPAGSPGPAGCCAQAARVWGHRQPRPWRCSGQRG